jgi:hypothetical protein
MCAHCPTPLTYSIEARQGPPPAVTGNSRQQLLTGTDDDHAASNLRPIVVRAEGADGLGTGTGVRCDVAQWLESYSRTSGSGSAPAVRAMARMCPRA